MDFIFWLIFIPLAILIAQFIFKASGKHRKEFETQLTTSQNFDATKIYISSDYSGGISIDEKRKKVCTLVDTFSTGRLPPVSG